LYGLAAFVLTVLELGFQTASYGMEAV